jgi:hypothetical protein
MQKIHRMVPNLTKGDMNFVVDIHYGNIYVVFYEVLRIRIRIRIRMFLGLPDPQPDPLVVGIQIRIGILPSSSKNSKINLDFYCFVNS